MQLQSCSIFSSLPVPTLEVHRNMLRILYMLHALRKLPDMHAGRYRGMHARHHLEMQSLFATGMQCISCGHDHPQDVKQHGT